MSPTAVRIIVALALTLFLIGLGFILTLGLGETGLPDTWCLAIANVICALILVCGWWLTWRSALPAHGRYALRTTLSGLAVLICVGGVPFLPTPIEALEVLPYTIALIAGGLWLVYTAWLYCRAPDRDVSGGFDTARLCCPRCGYSLIGLREARCPECGWSTTLDELLRMCVADPLG